LKIAKYPLTDGGQVTVSARGPLGDWGAARRSPGFEATQPAPTMFLAPLHTTRPKRKHH
jgi:hypothetical protein